MPAWAQRAGQLPEDLEEVGISQRLDEQLPLDLRFRDANGRAVRLGDYFHPERPVMLSLVYYECPMLCTVVLNGLLETLREMDWTPGEQFELVTVSIDPQEPPRLAQVKKQNMIRALGRPEAAAGWHFLTGEPAAVAELTERVGFRYRYLPESGEFAHPAALFVITPDGRISRYLFGVNHPPRTVRLSLVEAADGKIGSPVDQFLLYCYSYDAAEGRYTPVAMRIMRVAGGLTAIVLGTALVGLWRLDLRRRARARVDDKSEVGS